jgi:hypothetical protein
MPPRTEVMPSHSEWTMMIRNQLRAGFGVEDIHVFMRRNGVVPNHPGHIRALISAMRADGTLQPLYRRTT